ncbi:MAG: hypothetical protein A2498_12405 [Lentisphaerae bacterium RIFOXYC12_FULL_60_16]|nr:MAG: hypothetical protein A2498_12405 [Lentisphaerae bacterium RIFOXYC12_FULL_60_16]
MDRSKINKLEELINAVLFHDLQLARALIHARVNVNGKNCMKVSPLCLAAAMGNLAMVKLLLKAGARINAREDNLRATPLIRAAWGSRHGLNADRSFQVIKYLVHAGAQLNARDRFGHTALFGARSECRQAVAYLTNKGCILDSKSHVISKEMRGRMMAEDIWQDMRTQAYENQWDKYRVEVLRSL